jgi:hypothetical protein
LDAEQPGGAGASFGRQRMEAAMAEEREGKMQTAGREANAAQPLDAAKDKGGPERYPPVRQDDAVDRTGLSEQVRSFDPADEAPTPRDVDDASRDGGQKAVEGPQADPVEGKP